MGPGRTSTLSSDFLPSRVTQSTDWLLCCTVGSHQSSTSHTSLLCWAQSCPAVGDPTGSSVHGIFQARILECVAISYSRESSRPGDRTHVSCTGRRILYHWAILLSILYIVVYFFLSQSLRSSLHSRSEELNSTYWKEEYSRICGQILKLTEAFHWGFNLHFSD